MKPIYSREAAAYFLSLCFNENLPTSKQPIAGWDRRINDYVPLITPEDIDHYLSQWPRVSEI